MQDNITYWLEKRDRALTLPPLESRMTVLEQEIQQSERSLSKIHARYNQKSRNIARLERESFSAILLRLAGKLEARLEKAKREEIDAKLAYDSAAAHLNNLNQEKSELASRIAPLKADEQAFHKELEQRRAKIMRQLGTPQAVRYKELEDERNTIIPQITKLKEALRVNAQAISTAEKAAAYLEQSSQINNISSDIFSHLENSEKNLHLLFSQMRELMLELRGIHGIESSRLTKLLATPINIEFVFNHLSRMYINVRSQIRNKIQEVGVILNILHDIEAQLTASLHDQEDRYAQNIRTEQELLLSTTQRR